MLFDTLATNANLAFGALTLAAQGHLTLVTMATTSIFTLVLWRLWRFTITPALYPDDPKELPYWIPSKCRCSKSEQAINRFSSPG